MRSRAEDAVSGSVKLVVAGAIAFKLVVHALLLPRYGWHGDELYFVQCGRRLAWGYVDHAPVIPWIARLTEVLGGGLVALRIPALLAGAATMLFVALMLREWRGGAVAQLLALSACLFAPAYLRMGAMLDIPVLEVCCAAAASYVAVCALERERPRLWLLVGLIAGAGALVKHSMLLWMLALAAGLWIGGQRGVLKTRWPWLGAAIAALLFMPNLIWQAQHGFATLEFLGHMRRDLLAEQGRMLFAAGQLLYFHPLAMPICAAALASRRPSARPFVWVYIVLFSALLISGAKPYYLAPAYPALFAAGALVLERWFQARRRLFIGYFSAFALTGVSLGALTLPLFPLKTVDATFQTLLGWLVPPIALTHDMHGEFGWEEHVATVERVYQRLPAAERERALVLTGSYSQASAVNVLGAGNTPPAVSGHVNYFVWGPPAGRGDVLIAYGVPAEYLERHYRDVKPADRILAPAARPFDANLVVYLCRNPRDPIASWWHELKRYRHGLRRLK